MHSLDRYIPKLFLSAICLFFSVAQTSHGQASIRLSDESYISLITIYPGDQAYNMFGHSALRVRDPYHGFDLLYNYGTFSFDAYFLPKFIYGKLDYMLWVNDVRRELQKYKNDNRSVIEQVLELNAEQKQAVFDFLQYNAKKENRVYQYDFLFDNCSTRIRDVLERIMGNSLTFSDVNPPNKSFRHLLDPYIQKQPFLDAGIDLALAVPTDRIATSREVMFLPLDLMEAFDNATLITNSVEKPLVLRKETLFWLESPGEISSHTGFYISIWLVFVLALWVTNGKSSQALATQKWFDYALFGISGIAGLLAVFLWLVAIHTVTNYNWNLLWAWPTHLIALGAFSSAKSWLRPYMRISAFVVFITILGWYFWPQEMNVAFIPVLLALAVRSAWWGWKGTESAVTEASSLATDPN